MTPASSDQQPASRVLQAVDDPQLLQPTQEALHAAFSTEFVALPSDYGTCLVAKAATNLTDPQSPYWTVLAEFGVIRMNGPDSIVFLQNQVTNDIAALVDGGSCLAGYCTPKGRMMASFWVYRESPDSLFLITSRPLAAALVKRLKMFVLRSKTQISDVSADYTVLGLQRPVDLNKTDQNHPVAGFQIAIPAARQTQRTLWVVPNNRLAEVAERIAPLPCAASSTWLRGDCEAGLPWISPATSELFVPQMVNFELIGAVNFKKGCYPGQEVVARSHYLGKNKRRTQLAQASQSLTPGSDVWSEASTEPIGQVVLSAPPQAEYPALVLFETRLPLPEQLYGRQGLQKIALIPQALPYDVPDSSRP